MRYARIYPWRRTRRFRARSNGPEAFFVAQFSAGYTTNMFGFDLRQGQVRSRSALFMAPPQCDLAPSGTTFRMGLFVTPVPLPRGEVCWRISFDFLPLSSLKFRSGHAARASGWLGPACVVRGNVARRAALKRNGPSRGELRPQATFNPGFVWQSAGIGTSK